MPARVEWNSLILLLEPQAHTGWGPRSRKYNDCLVRVPDVRLAASPVLTLLMKDLLSPRQTAGTWYQMLIEFLKALL